MPYSITTVNAVLYCFFTVIFVETWVAPRYPSSVAWTHLSWGEYRSADVFQTKIHPKIGYRGSKAFAAQNKDAMEAILRLCLVVCMATPG